MKLDQESSDQTGIPISGRPYVTKPMTTLPCCQTWRKRIEICGPGTAVRDLMARRNGARLDPIASVKPLVYMIHAFLRVSCRGEFLDNCLCMYVLFLKILKSLCFSPSPSSLFELRNIMMKGDCELISYYRTMYRQASNQSIRLEISISLTDCSLHAPRSSLLTSHFSLLI